jgi:hypothetical protein
MSMFYPSYSFNLPWADLKDRFGYCHTIGGGYTYMTRNHWLITAEGNFIFGNQVKNRASLLDGILTNDGYVINQEGTYANLALTERGYSFWLKAGKLIPMGKVNDKTGMVLSAGAGMLQHKIRIDVSQNDTPQLRKDYRKGYDRLCNGPALTEYIGYQYLDANKKLNFFFGLELTQAFTESRRIYYFSENARPNEKRIDLLTGIKIGWIVPLYRKTGQEYYYY